MKLEAALEAIFIFYQAQSGSISSASHCCPPQQTSCTPSREALRQLDVAKLKLSLEIGTGLPKGISLQAPDKAYKARKMHPFETLGSNTMNLCVPQSAAKVGPHPEGAHARTDTGK